MNQRNIDALVKLLEGVPQRLAHRFDERVLAEWLAERGVLVPEALTEDECYRAIDTNRMAHEIDPREPEDFRAALTKIAKGED